MVRRCAARSWISTTATPAISGSVSTVHAGAISEENVPSDPFNFIHGKPNATNGIGPMVFEDVVGPQNSDCVTCHVPGTCKVPSHGTCAWSPIDAEPSLVASANASTFNPALTVLQSLIMAACGTCHIGTASRAHIASRTVAPIDECRNTCQRPGAAYEVHRCSNQGGNSDSTGGASPLPGPFW
jgi:hypothetical protein